MVQKHDVQRQAGLRDFRSLLFVGNAEDFSFSSFLLLLSRFPIRPLQHLLISKESPHGQRRLIRMV
jgi:hypothetical protein